MSIRPIKNRIVKICWWIKIRGRWWMKGMVMVSLSKLKGKCIRGVIYSAKCDELKLWTRILRILNQTIVHKWYRTINLWWVRYRKIDCKIQIKMKSDVLISLLLPLIYSRFGIFASNSLHYLRLPNSILTVHSNKL